MVVPLSDAEIVELYEKSVAARDNSLREADPAVSDPVVENEHWGFMYFLADIAIFASLVLYVTSTFGRGSIPFSVAAMLCLCMIPIVFVLLNLFLPGRSGRFSIGPVGFFTRPVQVAARAPKKVDPNNPTVLATVIDYIGETPIVRSKALQREITTYRSQLKQTLEELPPLIESFEREIRVAENEELLLILQTRRDAAQEALDRLRHVDENLASQHDEAEVAIQPILRMRDQFERYRQLSQSLSRIQAAHDLANTGEDKVRDNRLELRALYASAMSAQAKLAEIQSIMDATELAREEVRQLMA